MESIERNHAMSTNQLLLLRAAHLAGKRARRRRRLVPRLRLRLA